MSAQQQAYLKQIKKYKLFITLSRIFLFVIFLFLWEISARFGLIEAFIFSSPSRICICFYKMLIDGSILKHAAITLGETFFSFGLIIVFSIGTALLLWLCKPLSDILEPYLVVLNSLPKSALAPMLIVWLGNNAKAIIVTAISVAIFGTILNIYTSFADTDPDKIKLMKTFGGSRFQILTKLILPASLNTIVSNMKVNIGLCLVGVIIGEFLSAKAGLGYLITYASQTFEMTKLMSALIMLCLLSCVLYQAVGMLEKQFLKQ